MKRKKPTPTVIKDAKPFPNEDEVTLRPGHRALTEAEQKEVDRHNAHDQAVADGIGAILEKDPYLPKWTTNIHPAHAVLGYGPASTRDMPYKCYGIIAQEVERVIPEAIVRRNGVMMVDYSQIPKPALKDYREAIRRSGKLYFPLVMVPHEILHLHDLIPDQGLPGSYWALPKDCLMDLMGVSSLPDGDKEEGGDGC
jgi:hypothetical protein